MNSETSSSSTTHPTETSPALSLREIASWHDIAEITERPGIRASVPVLQRGLVWNPDQIELLWDSILRGFPIGALVISTRISAQVKDGEAGKLGVTHHLLDGQQRCDAIALAYKDPFNGETLEADLKSSKSILWLDLNPTKDEWSTREFVVRLTTPSHPWGYSRSDHTDTLSAGAIRNALHEIGRNPAAEGYQRPSPVELSPQVAGVAVPLAWLLLAAEEANLWVDLAERLDRSPELPWHLPLRTFLKDESMEEQREKVNRAIKRIRHTRIVALCAPDDLLADSLQESFGPNDRKNISSIEHLFQRLNQKGTLLDGEELAYSMVKAYWPELAGPIDQIARQLPATRLISLAIRAALATENRERLPNGLGVSAIRTMARRNDEKTHRVYTYIKNELADGCDRIDAWLRYDKDRNPSGILAVHIGNITRDSADLFLLLLTFAKRPVGDWEGIGADWPKYLQALVTVIHWFGRNKGSIANRIFAACADRISMPNIRRALAEATTAGDLQPIHSPASVENFLLVTSDSLESWRWNRLLQGDSTDEAKNELWERWGDFLAFREKREILLYAQRDYIHRRFSDYDPARKDFWKGHNRPWDFDHLLAWTYVNNRKDGGPFREVAKEWAKTIGNLRAWPFEDNRSDQADTALQKLSGAEGEAKRINSYLEEDELEGFSVGNQVRWESEAALLFVSVCRKRLQRIYEEWYDTLEIEELISANEHP
jgi:hypothetical protein